MEKIISDINAGKFSPIYFLHGDEPYFIDKITEWIDHKILTEAEKSFNQVTCYGKEVNAQQIIDNCMQFPMMANFRVIIVKEAQEMRDIQDLSNYILKPSPTSILVLAYKHKKPDKRTSFYKAVKNNAEIFESKKLYDNQIPAYISKLVSSNNRIISTQAAMLLSEYLGTNLSRIHNEIEKLCLSVDEKKEITLTDIQDQVGINKDFNIFELQSAIGAKQYDKVFQISKYFQSNAKANPMIMTISILYTYFTKVWVAAQNQHLGDRELSQRLSLYNSYFLKEYRYAAKQYSPAQLENAFKLFKEYDLKVKGVDNRSAVENELLPELLARLMI